MFHFVEKATHRVGDDMGASGVDIYGAIERKKLDRGVEIEVGIWTYVMTTLRGRLSRGYPSSLPFLILLDIFCLQISCTVWPHAILPSIPR